VSREARGALLARLSEMPGELRAAAARLGQAREREAPEGGGFSMVEQAWHLADLEREGFGARIARLLAEDAPRLPDFDGARVARERDYRARTLDEGLAAFAAARAENLARLRALPDEAWARAGTQDGVGPVTLGDLPRLMCEHDDSHRAEIAALLAGRGVGTPAWA
jgi:uncharacterized damage-inducible protein DinB